MTYYVGNRWASPCYQRHAEYWRFLRASYLGGRAWYDQRSTAQFTLRDQATTTHQEFTLTEQAYLTRHAREADEFYALRFRSSVYWNFMRPLVDGIAAAVARNARVTELPAQLAYIADDIDGHGTDLADFDRAMVVDLARYGHVNVYVTTPPAEREVYSVADQRDLGLVPRACIVSPIDLIRWSWDADAARYRWVLIRERVPADLAPIIDGSSGSNEEMRYRFRYVYPGGWTLYSQDGAEIAAGAGPAEVPVWTTVREQHPLEAEPIGVSLVEDVAELAKLVYNKFSWLTEEQRNHAFNQWFLKSPEPIARLDQVAFGSATYLGGFEDAKILSPSVEPMDHLESSMQNDIRARARGILGLETNESGAVRSGIAIALEREETGAVLAGLAKTFETAKRNWITGAARMVGAPEEDVVVRVDRDFSDLSAGQRTGQILDALKSNLYSGEAKARMQKELAVALLPNLSVEQRMELDAAIDAGVAESEMMRAAAMTAMTPEEDEDGEQDGEAREAPPFAR